MDRTTFKEAKMPLAGKKIAVLVEQQYEDLELWYPVLRFREANAQVEIVGNSKDTYPSKHGYPCQATVLADQVKGDDFDAVIIPGGYAPDHMRRHESMINFVKQAADADKIIAAICHGGWVLCSVRCLAGKKVTGFYAIKDDLENAGGEYVDAEVVRDGNLITSRVPKDLPAFCKTILDALGS
jgi:protease I